MSSFGLAMTQYYIVGELSSLLGDLQPGPDDWRAVVDELRHEVEHSSPPLLPPLAREALGLTDRVCWDALEHGDVGGFSRYAKAGAALREFSANAGLLSEGYSA